jgi:hypothetical protein
MPLSGELFDPQFEHFRETVRRASGSAFRSFHDGLAAQWEGYKPRLRERALTILNIESWLENSIGEGQILDHVIASIEITDRNDPNNLVRWQNRFGHANRSHHALLDARLSTNRRREFDGLFYDLYLNSSDTSVVFERLRVLTGGRYDLLAYLLFLKDMQRYMPIATKTFDQAFELLGIGLVTTGRCSWENYALYNSALSDIQGLLRERARILDARLIDAHSFCWMLIRIDKEILGQPVRTVDTRRSRGGVVTIFDARKKSIWEMANVVEQTVRNAKGQVVERMVKVKELLISRIELEKLIDDLMTKQENRCALTGIPFQFRGEHQDDQLLPSVDRIDSTGHYESSNLQIVCRFINFWKADADNQEFLRLLALVRGEGDELSPA